MSEQRFIPGLKPTMVTQIGPEASYYVRARVEASLPDYLPACSFTVTPAVVLHGQLGELSSETIQETFDRFLDVDDVFQEAFTKDTFLILSMPIGSQPAKVGNSTLSHTSTGRLSLEALPAELASSLKSKSLVLCVLDGEFDLPEGPYFIVGQNLHQAWRLYPDTLGAFSTTVVPDDTMAISPDSYTQTFRSLQSSGFTGADASVAVPSRLYFRRSDERPLDGMRIAVKDNIHLNGVITGLGNRAYAELYGRQTESAQFIQDLVNKGAVIVGKTKLSAFAGSEIPPCQCIDYFPPWNPRGDGYQGPSGSSSGAAAAAAGYIWLDFSICTDTTGSMRYPATSHGVWGHRSTWNSINWAGIIPSCPSFDTVGLLARTPTEINDVLKTSGATQKSNDWPTTILYPTEWFPLNNSNQQSMTDAFVKALEALLGVTHKEISLAEEWSKSGPEDLRDKSLVDLEDMAVTLGGYDSYHYFDDFRSQYFQKFQKPPYVSPTHTERWKLDEAETSEERSKAFEMIPRFRAWAFEKLLPISREGTCQTIMIVPHGRPGANYRDGPYKGDPTFFTSMLGVPQIVVPSTDLTLVKVAEGALKKAGWPTDILTGRFLFEVGDNERYSTVPQNKPNL
ncbi:amidase [Nannizzia gypsea CBS 118893]|uniref:Amidase n=1 Tax=Arthroderma gypseum (strain ATCC MYA-4604 / CBS 118893) TaxID=535722 RepID=E4V291_ARTGP|nr:amidase [Nannizzia gypsea CBS 118893]EFR04156.1 amidase [Nannizzia gypsea CBS 118893]